MTKFRRIVVGAVVACLLPLVAWAVANALALAAGCMPAAEVPCPTGGGAMAGVANGLGAVSKLAWVSLPVAGAVLLFWSLAEAARLFGESRRARRSGGDAG